MKLSARLFCLTVALALVVDAASISAATAENEKSLVRSCSAIGEVLCAAENPCVSTSLGRSGAKWACLPSAASKVCADQRFSCPNDYECDLHANQCVSSSSSESDAVALQENLHGTTQLSKQNEFSMCSEIQSEMPSFCTCEDKYLGATVTCSGSLPEDLDTFTMTMDLSLCQSPAHVSLTLAETEFGVKYTMFDLGAGNEQSIGIPGVSFDLDVLSGGLYVVFTMNGDISELDLSVGLDICGSVFDEQECMSSFSSSFPMILLSGTFDFNSYCEASLSSQQIHD